MKRSTTFQFNGTAGTYFEPWLIGWLLIIVTLGVAYPWAFCRLQCWKADHTIVLGRRLIFTGTGGDLFAYWLKWSFLTFLTFGIYAFWAVPQFNKWITEHTDFDQSNVMPTQIGGPTEVPSHLFQTGSVEAGMNTPDMKSPG